MWRKIQKRKGKIGAQKLEQSSDELQSLNITFWVPRPSVVDNVLLARYNLTLNLLRIKFVGRRDIFPSKLEVLFDGERYRSTFIRRAQLAGAVITITVID
jgi:hypothetical protein